MADLIAQGPQRPDRWRRRLEATRQTMQIGRDCGVWSVPWDACVSREHAQLRWDGQRLKVRRLPTTANPIFYQGDQADRFELRMGEHFVIGQTRFSLVDDRAEVSQLARLPTSQQTFSAESLRRTGFRHARQQVQALTRLPEIIAGADSDQELYARLVNLTLAGISTAEAAAVVAGECDAKSSQELRVLHWDRVGPSGGEFEPSGALIRAALQTQQSVVHHWRQAGSPSEPAASQPEGEFDWAFCSPIPGLASRGQTIYVAGCAAAEETPIDLLDALKFVELVATTVGHVRDLRRLQQRTAALSQFFSPPVRDAVAAGDPEVVLAPRKTEVTVLFCDLRGFSRQSERAGHDLFGLLQRVSEALGIMTRQILDLGGVVGDFHGDAAMGFWGWPLNDDQRVSHACRAALSIRAAFKDAANLDQHALVGFRVGMGLATGEAVAGKLGTVDQVKVTAFGPVVNLASRLEGLTRPLGVSILVDHSTAQIAQQDLPATIGRLRCVARLQPYGLEGIEDVYELVPSRSSSGDAWQAHSRALGDALTAFQQGDWGAAQEHFQRLAPDDPIRDFYLRLIRQQGPAAPADWDGVIRFRDKP